MKKAPTNPTYGEDIACIILVDSREQEQARKCYKYVPDIKATDLSVKMEELTENISNEDEAFQALEKSFGNKIKEVTVFEEKVEML